MSSFLNKKLSTVVPKSLGKTTNDIPYNTKRIWAVVPAAGTGQRMRSVLPKQYLPLLNYTVIEITLHKLLEIDSIHRIVVAVDKEDDRWSALGISKHPKIDTVVGGSTRQSSVHSALEFIHGQESESTTEYSARADVGADDEPQEHEWVLVHDAARPCVSLEKIDELISSSLLNNTGSILASPVTHTVKESTDGVFISQSKNRENLWLANTPQMFPLSTLSASLGKAMDLGIQLTDEASAVEAYGEAVRIVEDRRDNIKITLPEDLLWAETILNSQNA